MIFLFLAATFVAAQEDYVVFEGATTFHDVTFHPGNNYNWEVVAQFQPVIEANTNNYNFVNGNNDYETEIQWNAAGQYYLLLTETDASGCTNSKALVIKILPNIRSLSFNSGKSDSCFDPLDNSFQLPITVLNSEGQMLESQFFPLKVEFKIHETTYSQQLNYTNQELQINDDWFNAEIEHDTSIVIEITHVEDANKFTVEVLNGIHIHTIFSVPEIEFISLKTDTIIQHTSAYFRTLLNSDYSYDWWFTNSSGTRFNFNSTTYKTEEYFWETEGTFNLFVQATSENGCLSEVISKTFHVKEEELIPPELFALPDFAVGYENSTIVGNVSTNDFISPNFSWNLSYSLVDEPLPGLIFNSDGSFIYQPPQDFEGKIRFNYIVCFDEESFGCATSEVLIHLISSDSYRNIAPVATPDVALTFPNQIIVSNLLSNDIDPDGDNESLVISTIPVILPSNGTLEIAEDGSFSYIPDLDFEGYDKFMYRICDSGNPSLCDSAWAYIVVDYFGGGSSKPISISDDVYISNIDSVFTLTGNDYDLLGNDLIYNTDPIINTEHGVLEILEDGTFTYIPDSDYVGIDWFVYEVCNINEEPICHRGTGFILVNLEDIQIVGLAGPDTIIGACNPYILGGIQIEDNGFYYSWEPAEFLDDSTSPTPVFTPGSTTLFKLTVINDFGFYSVDSVNIIVSDVFAEAGDDLSMYSNSSIVLDGSASSGINVQYQWSTINGNIESGATSPNPIVNEFGTYYLEVTDQFGCVGLDSVNVGMLSYAPIAVDDYDTTIYQTEIKIPILDNDSDPENDIDSLTLTVTVPPFNGSAYVDYNDFTIHYQPDENFTGTDNFEYRICDLFENCDLANVTVLVTDFRFFIPDAFSPNGDNINDYFEILGIEWYEGNSIEIINRWGNKVYQAKNYGISTTPKFWDGKSNTGFRLGNEELPSGTYFYILNLGNGEKRIAGSVYLDR